MKDALLSAEYRHPLLFAFRIAPLLFLREKRPAFPHEFGECQECSRASLPPPLVSWVRNAEGGTFRVYVNCYIMSLFRPLLLIGQTCRFIRSPPPFPLVWACWVALVKQTTLLFISVSYIKRGQIHYPARKKHIRRGEEGGRHPLYVFVFKSNHKTAHSYNVSPPPHNLDPF